LATNIKYLSLAKKEFFDAISYYENQQLNLGRTFESNIKNSIKRISEFPEVYVKVKADIRRCVAHKFPYNILYSIEDNHILIIAIAHQHRKPDYWLDRIQKVDSL